MQELNWKRKEYADWDEAFRGLAPVIRQQSIRVADYTRALFVAACARSFGRDTAEGSERMRGQYADVAYKCGLYHQIGKALVPPTYQILQPDFSEEEQAVYRKYIKDGAELTNALQMAALSGRERRKLLKDGDATRNIPWLMIREACLRHMERWDGSGYPEGLAGAEIGVVGQLVGLAKELDRLSAGTKSEDPFEEAYAALHEQGGALWSPELIYVLESAKEPCREIYEKYIQYTMAVPKTIPLVEKRPDRPFGLRFRMMQAGGEEHGPGYDAIPYLDAVKNEMGAPCTADEQAEMLQRLDMVTPLSFYFLYEAADALLRLENCKVTHSGVLLEMLPEFYTQGTQLEQFEKLFEDQPVPREKLFLTVHEELADKGSRAVQETINRYLRAGIQLVLDNYHPERLTPQRLRELGFTWLRVAPEVFDSQEGRNAIRQLQLQGFRVMGNGADTHERLDNQLACGVELTSGPITGGLLTEEELIREALARERMNHAG